MGPGEARPARAESKPSAPVNSSMSAPQIPARVNVRHHLPRTGNRGTDLRDRAERGR
jgi:hypothetical protein